MVLVEQLYTLYSKYVVVYTFKKGIHTLIRIFFFRSIGKKILKQFIRYNV